MDIEEVSQDSGLESPMSKSETPERQQGLQGGSVFMSDAVPLMLSPDPDPTGPFFGLSAATGAAAQAKDDSPQQQQQQQGQIGDAESSYDDEPDETLAERLWGLTEMFPDFVVNTTHAVTTKTLSAVKHLYSFSRSALWIMASTSVILVAPVFFELEIAKIQEQQKSEQKQYLLGPNAAMIGANASPPMPR